MAISDFDKPPVKNTAHLINPKKSLVEKEANVLWNRIMSAKCAKPVVSGRVWYVSHNGDDSFDGKTAQTPLATLTALKEQCKPQAGDAILLECGGVYRGTLTLCSDMFLGSYGVGDKPCIYGSLMNYARAEWCRQGEAPIWQLQIPLSSDVGIIVLEHGKKAALKKTSLDELENDLDFYFDGANVFLHSDENPAVRFHSIDIGVREHGVLIAANSTNVTIDNITVKYVGGHGIVALDNSQNITIRNCEIGWVGGSYLYGTTPYGNGIEFWNGCEDVLVENNWVYQIFDTGISHQGNSQHIAKNILIRNNLVEYCDYASIEYWHHPAANNRMENITYSKNILRFSGAGWGSFRRGSGAPHIRSNSGMDNLCSNFSICKNIFEGCGTGALLYCESKVNTLPVFSSNRYIQENGAAFGFYGTENMLVQDIMHVKDFIKNTLKDKTGTFEWY